jgi:hypothetical protein
LRAHLARAADADGLGTMVCEVDLKESFRAGDAAHFWPLAARFAPTLRSGLSYGYQTIGLLAWVSGPLTAVVDKLSSRAPNGRIQSAALSNVGVCVTEEWYGPATLKGLRLSQSKHGNGPVVLLSVVTCSAQNRTTLTFSFV